MSLPIYYLPLFLLLVAIMAITIKTKKLTVPAALVATVLGLAVFQATLIKGIAMLLTFFVLSVLASSHKKALKSKLNAEDTSGNGRNTQQVLANGGMVGIAAVLTIIDAGHAAIYLIMMAASLASALADTLSSELGMVYGRRFYNIISFKREANGLDGVVSIEGTLIGMAGASIIALIYAGLDKGALIVVVAGIVGNLADSVFGALFERNKQIGNNTVNFLNTLVAAVVAVFLYLLC